LGNVRPPFVCHTPYTIGNKQYRVKANVDLGGGRSVRSEVPCARASEAVPCARASEAVDDMQRMDVARIRNGKRPTGGGGATHTKGRTKVDHHTEGRTKRPTGGRRGTHTGNTQTGLL